MPQSRTIPSRSYNAATRVTPDVPVDSTDSSVDITLTRESWPVVANIMDVGIFYSNDNGTNFRLLGRATTNGGDLVNHNGDPVLTFHVGSSLPDIGSTTRVIRGEFINTATLTTAVTASVS